MPRELATHVKVRVVVEFVTEIDPLDGSTNREAENFIREHYASDVQAGFFDWRDAEIRTEAQVTVLPLGPNTLFPQLKPQPSQGRLFEQAEKVS